MSAGAPAATYLVLLLLLLLLQVQLQGLVLLLQVPQRCLMLSALAFDLSC